MTSLPKTFCTLPYLHLNVTIEGRAKLCCRAAEEITSHGRPLSLYTDSLEEIWNSDYMREARRGMLKGERISACENCYRMEESGGTSLRHLANRGAAEQIIGSAREMVEARDAIAEPPSSLHLWLGNLCNLKCRMCSPVFSSQIAADAVHSAWSGPLKTEAVLLPGLVGDVEYRGFGELRDDGGTVAREVFVGRDATIVLRGNGDPISSIELSGTKDGSAPLGLTILEGDRTLAVEELADSEWRVTVTPRPLTETGRPLILTLRFGGHDQRIGIRRLELICEAPLRKSYRGELVSRFPTEASWAENQELLLGELFANPGRLRHVDFAGGEPMLNPHLQSILELIVDSGHAMHVSTNFSTNATVYVPAAVELLRKFEQVNLWFSLDGTGALQEYIRPPARWESVWRNVLRYAREPFGLAIHTTPQAYNIFGLLELVRLCDQHAFAFVLNNVLHTPRFLSLDMLPPAIVDEAIDEWNSYLHKECRTDQISEVETLIAYLRRPRAGNLAELQDQFVRFTNDLDRSRDQSLAAASPRLHRLLIEHGFDLAPGGAAT